LVAEVRGLGLLLAAQLVDGVDARAVAAEALRRGLVVNAVTPSALRLAPSLLVTDDEIAEAVATLAAVLADLGPSAATEGSP
ncbi:MAG TPA: aminotransferase class III-fold pyridoxal phosphate-dependent enzyme, partial [Aquihabitans sp.]|nr:aminotransferase class III-fold pyridoxal phosphate-dependent enzyme [Aquihabitans sp.]